MVIKSLSIHNDSTTIVDLLKTINSSITIDHSLALVGQSGSGKSLSLKAILNLLPNNLNANFQYESDFKLDFNNIGFIPQNPFTSLSPMTKIYKQFFTSNENIKELFDLVDLDISLKDKFPSQLSGGQLQRVVIAIALAKKPKLLLLDEPTTALDTKSKTIILELIQKLQKELNFLIIFVSHDIDSVQNICDDIAILKDGTICEYGKVVDVITNPTNIYTKQLISSSFKNREFKV